RNIKEISFIALAAGAGFLALALLTYHPDDPGWSQAVGTRAIHNGGGVAGAWIAEFLLYVFGYLGYLFPFIIDFGGYRLFRSRLERFVIDHFHLGLRVLGFLMAVAGGCGLCWMHFETGPLLPPEARGAGGILGDGAGSLSYVTFGGLG